MDFLRTGIVLGVLFAIVAMVVFGRSVTNMFPAPTIVPFQPYILRFLCGMLIGGLIPISIVVAVRFALISHFTRNIPR